MKRLSAKQRARIERLRRRRTRNSLRRKHFKYAADYRFNISFPEVMSLSDNYAETIGPIQKMKEHGHSNHRKPVVISLDMSNVRSVSAASLLVLNSEIDRLLARRWNNVRFVASKWENWLAMVVRQLERLGFFDLLEIPIDMNWPDEFLGPQETLLPMIACDRLMPERVQNIRLRLESVAEFFDQGPQVYEAMIEATDNAVRHGYKLPELLLYPPAMDSSWWATADYSPDHHLVRVLVFDQGVGIAATLDRWDKWELVRGYIQSVTGDQDFFNDDAAMIEAALKVSRTSEAMGSGHGQGLRDILSPVEETGSGSVRILSGRGGILYDKAKGVQRIQLSSHIGGTLIEWTLPVKQPPQD